MKITFTKWRSYNTPYFCFIPNETYYQISFVILNYHWWVSIKRKKK